MLTRRLRRAASAARALVALAVVSGPAAAQPTAAAPEITPANADLLLPPGYIKRGGDYVYEGGKVIVTPAYSTDSLGCSAPWLCLYRDANWGGTRWLFQDHNWQNLRDYGASDEVSSWSNHESRSATLGWDSIEQGKAPYLTLAAGAHASGMGGWNDNASSVLP
jgi:hypothetical protein